MSRASLTGLVLGATLACASSPPSAWVEVELLRGASTLPEAPPPPGDPKLVLVVDQTRSMQAVQSFGEPSPAEAARAATKSLLESLPMDSDVGLYVLGIAQGRECSPAVRISAPGPSRAPSLLTRTVESLGPRSEGSLAEALRDVGDDLIRGGSPARARVILMSDLRDECESDTCAALAELVQQGAQVDVVALGSEAPACLNQLTVAMPTSTLEALAPPPATLEFRVEAVLDDDAPPVVLAVGRANDEPVPLPSGRAVVVLETEPPFRIGPVELPAGQVTTVRGADFPAADASWRAWAVTRRPATPPVGSPRP